MLWLNEAEVGLFCYFCKMKTKRIFFLIIFCLALEYNLSAQNLFFIGSKSYPSTGSFDLLIKTDYGEEETLGCLIAKNISTGFFVISRKTMTGSVIKGNAVIYLDDGSVITLLDKGRRDYVDGTSTNVYTLTAAEIIKLKNSIINTVRFSIKCPQEPHCYSSEDGNFTASNSEMRIFNETLVKNEIQERINTIELISTLFK